MNTFVLLVLNGLTNAALLFVLGSGLTLAFGLMRVANLSHGAFYLVGGYIGLTIFRETDNWLLAFVGGGIATAVIGLVLERVLLDRVRGQALPETLLTVALSIIIADLCLAVWGGVAQTIRVPQFLNPRVQLLGVTYPGFRVFILILSVVIGAGLWLLLYKTKIGAAVRAGVDDRETVSALGINIERIFTFVFVLSAFLAGLAGVIGGSFLSLQPGADSQILILSLVVVILGGMGSLAGAAIGAIATGLLLSFGRAYVPELSFFILFVPMVLMLALRPQGLFGKAA
jgi:branched-chain amino acid transport system permease protein